MNEHDEASLESYPHGRGYGHDYMRGGEVFGGYGYAERAEYDKTRGELTGEPIDGFPHLSPGEDQLGDRDTRT